jgi:hypothetical protein
MLVVGYNARLRKINPMKLTFTCIGINPRGGLVTVSRA